MPDLENQERPDFLPAVFRASLMLADNSFDDCGFHVTAARGVIRQKRVVNEILQLAAEPGFSGNRESLLGTVEDCLRQDVLHGFAQKMLPGAALPITKLLVGVTDPITANGETTYKVCLLFIDRSDIVVHCHRRSYHDMKPVLKKVKIDELYIHLIPLNPAFEPVTVRKRDVMFLWKVVKVIKNL